MAQLQGSGVLELSDLIAHFSGGNKLSDFYRGDGLVPAKRFFPGFWEYGTWSSYQYQPLGGGQYRVRFGEESGFGYYDWLWNSTIPLNTTAVGTTSTTVGGYQYERGPFQGDGDYSIRRRTAVFIEGSSIDINQGIPTVGVLKLSDFYGAHNS